MADSEILAKKKKLEELKAKKAAREQQQREAASLVRPGSLEPSPTAFLEQQSADNLLQSVNHLLAAPTSPKGAPSPGATPQNAARKSVPAGALTVQTLATVAIVPEEKVTFNTSAQTDESDHGRWQSASASKAVSKDDDDNELEQIEERMRLRESELQKRVDEFLMEKEEFEQKRNAVRTAERAEARKHRPLTAAERDEIVASEAFNSFLNRASKLIERQLDSAEADYDFTRDYSAASDEAKTGKGEEVLLKKCVLSDPSRSGRAVTSIDWSPKYSELLVTSLAGQDDILSQEPDGTALVWNLHMPSRPEFAFYCQSPVLTAHFHPTNPSLIFGGTAAGQVVMWDCRESKRSPVHRTLLARGHVYPVYSLAPFAKSNKLFDEISLSTDGNLCIWADGNLHEPKAEIDLRNGPLFTAADRKPTDAVAIATTCFSVPTRGDPGSVLVGSDDGAIYKACIRADKLEKLGIEASSEPGNQHEAPVTAVNFQPNFRQMSHELLLTSSLDWTIRLWNYTSKEAVLAPLYTFDKCTDTVLDVQWAPAHPAVFASADSAGSVNLWNLTGDLDSPFATASVEERTLTGEAAAVCKLKWARNPFVAPGENGADAVPASAASGVEAKDNTEPANDVSGRQQLLAAGTSLGSVHVFSVHDMAARGGPGACASVSDAIRRIASSGRGPTAPSALPSHRF